MHENLKSSILMIISSIFYSLQNLNVKILTKYYSIWVITFFRGIISFLISLLLILIFKIKPILGFERKKLFIRGLLGSINIILGFLALEFLSISTTTIILNTSIIWFSLVAHFYYKEYWHFINNIGIIFILSGIFILSFQNEKKNNNIIGIILALLASIVNALANIFVKEIKNESTLVIGLYSMGLCFIFSSFGFFININIKLSIQNYNLYILILPGIFSLLAQNFKNKSLQITNNLGVIFLKNLDIIFSFLYDIFIFNYNFTIKELICILIIFIGCFFNKQ